MKRIGFFVLLLPVLVFGQAPKIVVGVVVDQMCYDYLYRFRHHFESNGFNRFLNRGVNCRNTNYNYVPTYTGPGHASIYTGTTPYNHGIVANEWFDRSQSKGVNCVFDSNVKPVGNVSSAYGQASPHHLETMTITDQLKFTYPTSNVYSVSIKDRSAVLPGGHLSDGSYWFDYSSGRFITSSFYTQALPAWIQVFNEQHNADTYLSDWDLFHKPDTYSRSLDNSPYEITLKGTDKPTFPYKFTEFAKGNYSQFTITPFANTLLTDLALELIKQEALGKHETTDMLCISYSTPDIAGHAFGPYSLEIEDIYVRLDRELVKLFNSLDQQVGKNNYVIFLTADHAVVPVPQQLTDEKLPGGYFDMQACKDHINAQLILKYGHSLIQSEENQNIYLNHQLLDSLHIRKTEIQQEVAAILRGFDEIKVAVTGSDLERGIIQDPWMEMILNGYSKERSGDVIFILKPGYLAIASNVGAEHKGTSHGSAFNYDTHVPLLWYGNKMKSKDIFRPIEITDISATLVHLMNLQRIGSMTGKPIVEILGQ
ncbi:MAG: alkaline phosphatase family protein [Flavobacteriales bacterium]